MTRKLECPLKLIDISDEDRNRIAEIFAQDDAYVLNLDYKENDEGVGYFVVQLENDCDDVFYDHSTPFDRIFKELGCVCTAFSFQNEYGDKNDTNTAYAIWFEKIDISTLRGNKQ